MIYFQYERVKVAWSNWLSSTSLYLNNHVPTSDVELCDESNALV